MSGKSLQKYLQEGLSSIKNKDLLDQIKVSNGGNGPTIEIHGKKLINLSSTNYLGFSYNPRVVEAAVKATERYGAGTGSTRRIGGTLQIHEELEMKLAKLLQAEAVMTFQSAYNCNIGTIAAIIQKEDAILSDEYNHSSIVDGCILSGATVITFKHSNLKDLTQKAKEARESGRYGKIMIITDGIFSVSGDIAKLQDIIEISEEYDLITYVDDAHAIGIIGQNGSGSSTHHDIVGKIDIQIGTLSKAIGVVGGYVAGSKELIEWIKLKGNPFLFSASMTPGAVGACIEAINILNESTELIDKLWHNGRFLKRELKKLGFNIGGSETPITPCIFRDNKIAEKVSSLLLEKGVYARVLSFSSASVAANRIRNMPIATHSEEMLREAVNVYEKVSKELDIS